MQPLVHPTMDRVPLKHGPHGAPMSAVVVEEGLPCLTQLAIWSALLLGVAGTALGAAGFAFSQQNKGLIEEYVYSPPAAPPSSVLGGDHCLESVFMDLKGREVQLWTPAPAGGAASGVSWPSPVVYVIEGGRPTAQAERLGQQNVGDLLAILRSMNTFMPSFTPSSVLGGKATVLYTPAPVAVAASITGKTPLSFAHTQTPVSGGMTGIPITITGRLYLSLAAVSDVEPVLLTFQVHEEIPSMLGVRKIVSYSAAGTYPTISMLTKLSTSYLFNGVQTTTEVDMTVVYEVQLSGRRLANGKFLHGVYLVPQSATTLQIEAETIAFGGLTKLPSFYWELEEDARCGLVG